MMMNVFIIYYNFNKEINEMNEFMEFLCDSSTLLIRIFILFAIIKHEAEITELKHKGDK